MSGITRTDFGKIRKATQDLAFNEQLTLKRLSDLEQWATAFTHRTLWQRFRWLLLGR